MVLWSRSGCDFFVGGIQNRRHPVADPPILRPYDNTLCIPIY